MIPRTVHRLWLGDKKMPERYKDYARAWRSFGYEVIDWTEATLHAPLINADVWDIIPTDGVNVGGGIQETGVAVQRADMASYELIFLHGGIYANCDIEPRRDLHELLEGVEAFGVVEQWEYLSNALMGCTAGHPFFGEVIDTLPKRYFDMPGAAMNEQTGPHLLTAVGKNRDDITVLWDGRSFFPYTYGGMDMEGHVEGDWYVEHHWGHKHPELLEG
jgi:mannosyltransferase OCH1-like enzyme